MTVGIDTAMAHVPEEKPPLLHEMTILDHAIDASQGLIDMLVEKLQSVSIASPETAGIDASSEPKPPEKPISDAVHRLQELRDKFHNKIHIRLEDLMNKLYL